MRFRGMKGFHGIVVRLMAGLYSVSQGPRATFGPRARPFRAVEFKMNQVCRATVSCNIHSFVQNMSYKVAGDNR